MNGLYDLEDAIIARLKEHVPALKHVAGVNDPVELGPGSHWTPAAAVVHDGYRALESRAGVDQIIAQRWLVAVIVHAPNERSGAKARAEAGPLFMAVIDALKGWKPTPGTSRMELADGPGEEYTDDGLAIFPAVFVSKIRI